VCTISPPAERHDNETGAGVAGGAGAVVVAARVGFASGGAARAACVRGRGSPTSPMMTVTTSSAVPTFKSTSGTFSGTRRRERTVATPRA